MLVYIFGYILLLGGSFFWWKTQPQTRFIYFLGLFLICILVILRGDVGTDTGTYEVIIDQMTWSTLQEQKTEFGFNISSLLLKETGLTSPLLLRVLTAFYALLVFLILLISKGSMRQVIAIYFIPTTIFIFSMNALRIGIASNIFILALLYYDKNKLLSYLLALTSLSFHISILILIPVIILFQKFKFKFLVLSVLAPLAFISLIYLFQDHITNKLLLYISYSSPNVFSGISHVIVFITLLFFFYTYPISKKYKLLFILTTSTLIIISLMIAKFSYAGLRFLQLYTLFFPIIFIFIASLKYKMCRLSTHSFYFLFLSAVASVLFTLRNFIDSEGSPYAFIPYTFFF